MAIKLSCDCLRDTIKPDSFLVPGDFTRQDVMKVDISRKNNLHKILLDGQPLCYGTKARVAKPGQRR